MLIQSVLALSGRRLRRGSTFSVLGFALFSGVVFGDGVTGCLPIGGLGSECVVNSDCLDATLVCASQICHTVCENSADCTDRDYPLCLTGDSGQYCDERRQCQKNEQCPDGQACGSDGLCATRCTQREHCLADQSCQDGACVQNHGESEGMGGAPVGESCIVNSGCASWSCLEGFCRGCTADIDCPPGRVCDPDGAEGGRCTPSDCVDCTSALGRLLLPPDASSVSICPESKPVYEALIGCACDGPGTPEDPSCTAECKSTLCTNPPQLPSEDCAGCLLTTCAAQTKTCAEY